MCGFDICFFFLEIKGLFSMFLCIYEIRKFDWFQLSTCMCLKCIIFCFQNLENAREKLNKCNLVRMNLLF